MKQKYYVNVHYDVVLTTEVVAESEEEAHKLSIDKAESMPLNNGDVCGISVCTTQIDQI